MNIWKRFLSLALAFSLVLGMIVYIPAVTVEAASGATAPEATYTYTFDAEETAWTKGANYAYTDGKLVWTSTSNGTWTDEKGTVGEVGSTHTKYSGGNGQTATVTGVDGTAWTDYTVSADVTVTKSSCTLYNSGWAMAGLVVYGNVTVRVRPTNTANTYSVSVYSGGTAVKAATTGSVTNGSVTDTSSAVSFNLTARVQNGQLTVYVDDSMVWQSAADAFADAAGTAGVAAWTSGSNTLAAETISYDNFTVAPIYVPEADMGGEVVAWYESANSGNAIDTDMWTVNSNYTITDGKIVTTGSFTMTTPSATKYQNGSIVADITLPTGTPTANGAVATLTATVGSNQAYNVRFFYHTTNGWSTELFLNDAASANSPNMYGGAADGTRQYDYTIGKTDTPTAEGNTFTVKFTRIGNFVQVTYTEKSTGKIVFDKTFNLNPNYTITTGGVYFGITGVSGVSIDNVIVTSYDTVVNTVTLPNGVTANALKEIAKGKEDGATLETFNRTHYAAGEMVTLTVDTGILDITTLKVNSGTVVHSVEGSTVTFTMPQGAATVTCDPYATYTVTAGEGITVDPTEAKAGTTVTIKIDETVFDATKLTVTKDSGGTVATDGSDGVYTFTMPAEAVTVTCEVKQLAANEELYNSNGKTGLTTTDGWSDDKAFTETFNLNYTGATITDGYAEVTFTLPETRPADVSNPQYNVHFVLGSVTIEGTLLYQITNANALYFRLGIRNSEYNSTGFTQIAKYDIKNYNGDNEETYGSVWGKEVTMKLYKVGNYLKFDVAIPELSLSKTMECTLSDTYVDEGYTVNVANKNVAAAFSSIKVVRFNKTAKITLDDSAALVSLPSYNDPAGTSFVRSDFQFGETIALTTTAGYVYYANGEEIKDPENFEIPDAETVTITCKAAALEPFYTNDFSANYDGLTLGSISLDDVVCGRFTHTDGQLVITKDAGVDNKDHILATMASHEAVLANGFVTSLDITAYKQKTAEGADSGYPWILFTVNNKIQFRVIPAPTEDAPNRYGFVINNGESAGWVNAEGTGTSSVVWHYIELPGTMNTGTDGGVTYNVAVKLVGNAYTMYINGQQVFTGTTTADLSTNKVTFGGATSSGNTKGFTLKFDNLRIDHVGAVEDVIFGQKQLALDADLAMDFYIALPSDSTATTATITLGDEVIDTVTLANAERKVLYTYGEDNAWISWYIVTAKVPVKDIAKDVTVTLDDGSTYSYSVEDYADYIVKTAGYSESVKKVAQSLLDYGTVAATYFNDRTGSATLDAELSARLDEAAIANTWAPTKTGTNEYISLYGCSLEAVEDANICMYFQLVGDHDWAEDDSNVSVTVNGETVTNVTVTDAANGYKRVKITGIHAADLDVVYTVTVTSEHGDLTVSYSGLSYAYTAANYSASRANLKALAKALYNYWDAAQNMN